MVKKAANEQPFLYAMSLSLLNSIVVIYDAEADSC